MTEIYGPLRSGVYAICNLRNGKVYVGSAVNFKKRWQLHLNALRRGDHHSRHLQASWRRDGEAAFTFTVLEFCDKDQLLAVEQGYIDKLSSHHAKSGYNSRPTASSNLGHKFSAAAVEKNRRAQTGKKQSAETIYKRTARQRGRRLTPDWAAKVQAAKQGRLRPDIAERAKGKFSVDVVTRMRSEYEDGATMRTLASKYECAISTICRCLRAVGPAYSMGGVYVGSVVRRRKNKAT